ncbi:MAG: winged helix DNA-binding domain-containing protein [Actinomycetota bacterium]|nr:winged helix DNA-binding domain-containing protein [Actinomycetota bacterium]
MAPEAITQAQLNRATLARQGLLERERTGVVEAVERLGPLQAQEARPPFLALWSRVEGFRRADLHAALHDRSVLRSTFLRATLHLTSAADHVALRATLQPVLTRAAQSIMRARSADFDPEMVLAAARRLLAEGPLTFNELRAHLVEAFPKVEERAMGYVVRMHLALAMVPTEDRWAFSSDSAFTPSEDWLGTQLAAPDPPTLVRSYLRAFGPAGAADLQAWSGLKGAKEVLQGMDDELVEFRAGRRAVFDLPDAPRPDGDVPAPPRLLPEFDTLVLAYKDRTRLVADEHRTALVTKNLRILATFLVHGMVAGTWTLAAKKGASAVELAPFGRLAQADRHALEQEGDALARFVDED